MNAFAIENGIQPPPSGGRYVRALRTMKIGDSVLVSAKEASCFLRAAKYDRITVTTRKQQGTGVRVWLLSRKPKKRGCRESRFVLENKKAVTRK